MTVKASDKFFWSLSSLFDTMAALWENLDTPQHQNIMTILDSFYKSQEPWSKYSVYRLCEHIALQDVAKVHACYLLVKDNQSLVFDPDDEPAEDSMSRNLQDYDGFSWKPKKLFGQLGGAMADKGMEERAFNHVANHVARHHDHGNGLMVPLSYLDIVVLKTQEWMFNPNVCDMIIAVYMM